MNNITLTISQEEANECLKALIFRADTLNEKIKEAGQRGKVEQIINLATAVKTMQTTMNKLSDAGATI
jgi:hypothetical protein